MTQAGLALFLLFLPASLDRPFPPVWSPDHSLLASTTVSQRFVTPEGGSYRLQLNGRVVYPKKARRSWFAHSWFSTYQNVHTFLSDLAWSPDSRNVAFLEKLYDWEYADPFNSDFEGSVSNERFVLVIVSSQGKAAGYRLKHAPKTIHLRWDGPDELTLTPILFT